MNKIGHEIVIWQVRCSIKNIILKFHEFDIFRSMCKYILNGMIRGRLFSGCVTVYVRTQNGIVNYTSNLRRVSRKIAGQWSFPCDLINRSSRLCSTYHNLQQQLALLFSSSSNPLDGYHGAVCGLLLFQFSLNYY